MKSLVAATIVVAVVTLLSSNSLGQSISREQLVKKIEAKRAELQLLEEKLLAPSEEDLATYSSLLESPDTGLIRLLPRELFDSGTYKEAKKSLTIRGGGAYYSFSRRTHEYGVGSDISLQRGHLSVGFAGADFGFLTDLGAVLLQDIRGDHPSVQVLSNYKPPIHEPEARLEHRRFQSGSLVEGVDCSSSIPVTVGTTYLLRSIGYDKGDLLVALQVVRKDDDGSVVILWKLLNKYAVPQFAKNN